jgi:hypothetical protein
MPAIPPLIAACGSTFRPLRIDSQGAMNIGTRVPGFGRLARYEDVNDTEPPVA